MDRTLLPDADVAKYSDVFDSISIHRSTLHTYAIRTGVRYIIQPVVYCTATLYHDIRQMIKQMSKQEGLNDQSNCYGKVIIPCYCWPASEIESYYGDGLNQNPNSGGAIHVRIQNPASKIQNPRPGFLNYKLPFNHSIKTPCQSKYGEPTLPNKANLYLYLGHFTV